MAEHLSTLELDELAAGFPVNAHAKACDVCAARLVEITRARRQFFEAPEASRVRGELMRALDALGASTARRSRRPSWLRPWLVPVPLALAAGVATLVVVTVDREPPSATRLKGDAHLEVLSADGAPIERAHPGDYVWLAVGTGGHTHAVVVGVEPSGEVSLVWPSRPDVPHQVESGARVRLPSGFEVTDGSTLLIAFFSDGPLDAARALALVRAEVERAIKRGEDPLSIPTPAQLGAARARRLLRVEAR